MISTGVKNKTLTGFLKTFLKRTGTGMIILLGIGFLIPQDLRMPVENATRSDYNPESFWYYPWGRSVTHKGVDIFAAEGTSLISSTKGIVLSAGEISRGGKYILVLGPKWRLHYYAHLHSIETRKWSFLSRGELIGKVGTSGNARGKSPHLHYSILTIIPYVWRIDNSRQGWKKMFYLNPITYLDHEENSPSV